MNPDTAYPPSSHGRAWRLNLVAWVAVPAVALVALIGYLLFSGGKGKEGEKPKVDPTLASELPLALARTTLLRHNDLGSYRTVVNKLNEHLADYAGTSP